MYFGKAVDYVEETSAREDARNVESILNFPKIWDEVDVWHVFVDAD